MKVKPVATLVVGYGNMGSKHARALRELGGAGAVWGVVDPRADRRNRASQDHERCRTFADVEEAVSGSERPGCAIVAASTQYHFPIARRLLESRIPTLVEKPIAASSADGRTLMELAARRETLLTVGHVERFNPSAVAARKLVMEKVIGDTIQICFRRVGGTPADVNVQGDVLADLAVHDYDLTRFITGAELEIVEALGHREEGRLDGVLVLGALSNGASLQLQVNWRTPVKIRRVELTGTAGHAEINLITQQVVLYRQNPLLVEKNFDPDTHSYYNDYLLSFASPDRVELGIVRKEPLQEELAAFWRAVLENERPPVSAADAVRAVELTEATRQRVDHARLR
jgi:UDP-N-acetylglucosamine 3-dehydrogenase